MGTDARNATRNGIVVGIVAMSILVVVFAAVALQDGEEEEEYEVLAIDSLAVESGSYFPRFWVNASENLVGYSLDLDFVLYDSATGERSLTSSPMSTTRNTTADGTEIRGTLNLYHLNPGTYYAHLFMNATMHGFESPDINMQGHATTNVTLSGDRPPPPEITAMRVEYNTTIGKWQYAINMTDPDADGDSVEVWLGGKSGYVIYYARGNNSENATYWTFEGVLDVQLGEDGYSLTAGVTDKHGPRAYEWMVHFYP